MLGRRAPRSGNRRRNDHDTEATPTVPGHDRAPIQSCPWLRCPRRSSLRPIHCIDCRSNVAAVDDDGIRIIGVFDDAKAGGPVDLIEIKGLPANG
jgi:hypothetical protein